MNITISDLAKMTGLAKSTISGVLNNKGGFSEKTRQKVLAAAKLNGYVPNELARGLNSKFTKTIGLLIKDITNPFYNQLTKGVQDVANEYNYTVFLCSSGENHEAEIDQVHAMIRKRVDGLIISPLLEEVNFDHLYELKKSSLPFAMLGKISGLECDCVEFDDYNGGEQVTHYLIQQGHTHIGFIAGLQTSRASKLRYTGFKDTLLTRGLTLDPHHVFTGAKNVTDGVSIGNEIAAMANRPTAFICFDDAIALGVIKSLTESGIRVPEDLSIIGFDDIELAVFPLTTVSLSTYEAGRTLAKTLFERILGDRRSTYKKIVIPEKLVIRSSVKDLKRDRFPSA